VEEDVQQINLTRFNLFFPEKRDFFIEGQGIFDFGGVQAGNSPGDVPLLFSAARSVEPGPGRAGGRRRAADRPRRRLQHRRAEHSDG
jgi:hypothetical protein